MYDLNKHLTTLTTGSLVLIATFMKDIFPSNLQTPAQIFLGGAFGMLVLSLGFAVGAMRNAAVGTGDMRGPTNLALGSFFLGIVTFLWVVFLTQMF